MPVSDYFTTAASNTTLSGINIAENCPPSSINDAIRQTLADIRRQVNDLPWVNFGTGSGPPAYVYAGANQFKIPGSDATSFYLVGQRVRAVGSATGTIFGTISGVTYAAPDTAIFVSWDSGTLQNEAITIAIAPTTYLASGGGTISGPLTLLGTLTLSGNPSSALQAVPKQYADAIIPAGIVIPFAGLVAPAGYLFCDGAAVSRTGYANLFAAVGTTYGSGDGTTTFNLPDLRGRVVAARDDLGGTAANRLQISATLTTTAASISATVGSAIGLSIGMTVTNPNVPLGTTITTISGTTLTLSTAATSSGTAVASRFSLVGNAQTLGGSGGTQTHTLVTAQMPAHTHLAGAVANSAAAGSPNISVGTTSSPTAPTGGDQAHPNIQPTFLLNYLIKT